MVSHTTTNLLQILFAYEDERGEDAVESIDFWKSNKRSDVLGSLPASQGQGIGLR